MTMTSPKRSSHARQLRVVKDAGPIDGVLDQAELPADLPELAGMANQWHGLAGQAKRNQVEAAWHAGRALSAAKKLVPHGEWADWLAANFHGSERTAQVYMQLFMTNPQSSADLSQQSIDRLLKAIRDADLPADAEIMKVWEEGRWRSSSVPSTFHGFCVANYGRKAAGPRRVVVAKLRDQGLTIDEIKEQVGG
jgi:hypothetical protein